MSLASRCSAGPDPASSRSLSPLVPERQSHDRPQYRPCDHVGYGSSLDLLLRQVGMPGKVVGFWLVHEDELRVVTPDTAGPPHLRRAVDVGPAVAFVVELLYPLLGDSLQILYLAEHDGVGRAGLGAGRFEAILLAVVAERALEGAAVVWDLGYDTVGTGGDAVAAAVADVGLDVDVVELVADDGARRARLLARRLDAVLAHVAHKSPASQGIELRPAGQRLRNVLGERYEVNIAGQAALPRVLYKRDVAPGGARELLRVVVGVARQLVAIGRELVPLLAGDLAGLAPYTDRSIGQEPCRH